MSLRPELGRVVLQALNPVELMRLGRALPKSFFPGHRNHGDRLKEPSSSISAWIESSRGDDKRIALLYRTLAADGIASDWIPILQDLLERLERGTTSFDPRLTIEENFAAPVARIIGQRFLREQSRKIDKVLSEGACNALVASLRTGLVSTGRPCIAWTWRALAETPSLSQPGEAAPTDGEFAALFFADGIERRTRALLCRNPALARLWAIQSELWLAASAEFLCRAEEFLRGLNRKSSKKPLRIESLASGQSDPHRGNRSVIRVALSNKREWYYKPRSGTPEAFWENVLRAVDDLKLTAPFRRPRLIRGRNHFWMEAVAPRSCRNRAEAAEFYFKAGLMLYLLHRLRGVDFHAGNMIACGRNPVLVDCETLLHPAIDPQVDNVLGIGFLPLAKKNRTAGGFSALGRISPGEHSVRVAGHQVLVSDFVPELVAGFLAPVGSKRGQSVTVRLREALQTSRFRRSRHLFRSTRDYVMMMASSLSVRALASGVARQKHLRLLCEAENDSPVRARAEARALEQGDVPIFYARPANLRNLSRKQLREQSLILREACRKVRKVW